MANILIIDDDVVMTELLSQAIKERGHDFVCTHTLEEGLAAAKSGTFAVAYLDVCLPDGNGLDAIPELRNAHLLPGGDHHDG